jgi:hypothetical protein
MTTVNLSKNTFSILKNFATLNSNLLVKPGNVIKTITPSKNGMAVASVEETFDTEFGIWDLNKFLGVVSLFNNPNFTFGEKSVKIKNGGDSIVNYYYSEPKLVTRLHWQLQNLQFQNSCSISRWKILKSYKEIIRSTLLIIL